MAGLTLDTAARCGNPNKPDVFISLSHHVKWIESITNENTKVNGKQFHCNDDSIKRVWIKGIKGYCNKEPTSAPST